MASKLAWIERTQFQFEEFNQSEQYPKFKSIDTSIEVKDRPLLLHVLVIQLIDTHFLRNVQGQLQKVCLDTN